MNALESIIDFINGKSKELVDYVLDMFNSLSYFLQAVILLLIGILVLIGIVAVIKKSFKFIIIIASILVIGIIIWTFL